MGYKWYHIIGFCAVILLIAIILLPGKREDAILLARSGKYKEAEPVLTEIMREFPDDKTVLMELAKIYTVTNQQKKGMPLFFAYLERHPTDNTVRNACVDMLMGGFYYDQAIAILQTAPPAMRDNQKLLEVYQQAGDLNAAIAILRSEMEGNADDIVRWREIAKFQRWQMNFPGLIQALEELAQIQPEEKELIELLWLYDWQDNMPKAVDTAARLTKLTHPKPDTLRAARSIFAEAREVQPALAVAKRITTLKEATPQDWLDLAGLQYWEQDREGALATLEAGIQRFPSSVPLLRQAAWHAAALDKVDQVAALQEAIARITGNETDFRNSALAYSRAGDPKRGIELLRKFAENSNAEAQTLWALAELSLQIDDKTDARSYAERLQAKLQEQGELNPQLLMDLVLIYERIGETKAELAVLQILEKFDQTDPEIALGMAQAYSALEMPAKGLAILNKFGQMPKRLQVERDDVLARLYLQRVQLMAQNDPTRGAARAEAIDALEKILTPQNKPEQYLAQELIALLLEDGKKKEAQGWIAKLQNVPDSINLELAAQFLEGHDKETAVQILARIQNPESLSVDNLSRLAYLYNELDNLEKAITFYKLADEKSGGKNKEIRLSLADTYGALKDFKQQYAIVDALAREGGASDWLAAADRRLWNNDPQGESDTLTQGLSIYPDNLRMLARQIRLQSTFGNEGDAVALLKRLDRIMRSSAAKDPNLLLEIALAYGDAGYAERGLRILESLSKEKELPTEKIALARARLLVALVRQTDTNSKLLAARRQSAIASLKAIMPDLPEAEQQDFIIMLAELYLAETDIPNALVWMEQMNNVPTYLQIELAAQYAENEQYDKAREIADGISVTPDMPFGEVGRLGYIFLRMEDGKRAVQLYLEADKRAEEKDKDIRLGLADAYGLVGETKKQYEIVDAIAAKGKAEDWLAAADRRALYEDSSGQARILGQGLHKYPKSALLRARYVLTLSSIGDSDEAKNIGQGLDHARIRKETNDLITVGYALLQLEQYAEARRLFLNAQMLAEDEPEPIRALASVDIAEYKYADAVRRLRIYLHQEPDAAGAWYDLGTTLRAMGRSGRFEVEKAKRLLDSPDLPSEIALRGRCKATLGEYRAAIADLSMAHDLRPTIPAYALDLAEMWLQADDPTRAELLINPVLAAHPALTRARLQSARIAVMRRNPKQAVEILLAARRDAPEDTTVITELARAEDEAELWETAIGTFEEAKRELEAARP